MIEALYVDVLFSPVQVKLDEPRAGPKSSSEARALIAKVGIAQIVQIQYEACLVGGIREFKLLTRPWNTATLRERDKLRNEYKPYLSTTLSTQYLCLEVIISMDKYRESLTQLINKIQTK